MVEVSEPPEESIAQKNLQMHNTFGTTGGY